MTNPLRPVAGGGAPKGSAEPARPTSIADPAVRRKVERLGRGERPRVLDLFSGCGGISLGFHREGFEIVANIEADPVAARSHALNLHPTALELHGRPRDITDTEPAALAAELGLGDVTDAIDVIVGGPPCQAYARVGRAKLGHLAADPHAFKSDRRRDLYHRYLLYVERFRPLMLLMENVPEILNQHGHNVVEEIISGLSLMGYDARYTLVNAAHQGVPQTRDRLFMIAFRKEIGARTRFPNATHHVRLPPGYGGSRSHALKGVKVREGGAYVPSDSGGPHLPPAITAREAIADLPFLLGPDAPRGARHLGRGEATPYAPGRPSDYAWAMRTWPGFEAGEGVRDHVIRRLPRDGAIFADMPQGAEYPVAHGLAVRRFERRVAQDRLAPETKEWLDLRAAMVPPYDVAKFANKWWKLREDFPTRTLMAHLSRDCYSHIHYDSAQARTISVREAARLQSFPDGWVFAGTMNPGFRQIGNAVPPLVAAAMARAMREAFEEASCHEVASRGVRSLAA